MYTEHEAIIRRAFPALQVDPTESYHLDQWIRDNESILAEHLLLEGAVLLRGLNIDTPERLDEFVSLFPLKNFPYNKSLSNALRINKTPRVFTANEAPADINIVLHHEMAQTPLTPDWLFFSCSLKAEAGGTTPICRSDDVYQSLATQCPRFLAHCEAQGLYYRQKFAFYPDGTSAQGRSWPHLLGLIEDDAKDELPPFDPIIAAAAESKLNELGYRWQWHGEALEIISPILPAVKRARNNQKVFFNQLLAAFTSWNNAFNTGPQSVFFGNGQTIDRDDVKILQSICEKHTLDIRWEVGDVAILDNDLVMHGRRAYSGKRQVFASLAIDAG